MLETIITSVATALFTGLVTFSLQERKLKSELRTEFMAEQVAKSLLEDERWPEGRSFSTIKKRLRGFEDNELRKILVRAGAICLDKNGEEHWGLLSKNRKKL